MVAEHFLKDRVNLRFSRQFMPIPVKQKYGCIIVGEDAVFRVKIVKYLNSINGIKVLTEGALVSHISEKLDSMIPDLAVINVKLGGQISFNEIRQLKEQYPKVLILVIAEYTIPKLVKRILLSGANGYLRSPAIPAQLGKAIKALLAGKVYLDIDLANSILENVFVLHNIPPITKKGIDQFSEKEFSIFLLTAQGKNCREIAEVSGFSLSTVQSYIKKIRSYLGLKKNSQVKQYAADWMRMVNGEV